MHRTFLHRLSTKEAASYLGYSVSTLRHWRKGQKEWHPGLGPHFFCINGRVWYTAAALALWARQYASDGVFSYPQASDSLA